MEKQGRDGGRRGRNGCPGLSRAAGVTLIEAIAVALLMAILAIFVMNRPSWNNRAEIEADALKSALRYAQSRAMADVYTWGIQFTADGYSLVDDNPSVTHPLLPGQGGATRNMPSGVTIATSDLGENKTVYFDWRGRPVKSPITSPGGAADPVTDWQTITLTQDKGVDVVVTPYTGFVP